MSCCLVTEDFTDQYYEHADSDDGTDTSSVQGTLIDDGDGSDTDVEPDDTDAPEPRYIDLHASNMSWGAFASMVFENFQRNAPANLRLAQKRGIVDRIFDYAMQANGNKIVMPRFAGFTANAGVATGLLAVNHDLYHQCRDTMYRDNEFVVDALGSGLQHLSQNMGINLCGHVCTRQPTVQSLRLVVGCDDHDEQGIIQSQSFIQALNDMANKVTVQHLKIELRPFCFFENKELAAFAFALKEKIKVEKDLLLSGFDYHWEWNLRLVPMAMGMQMQPMHCDFQYHNDQQQKVGPFCCRYQPAQSMNEKLGLDADGTKLDIHDGKHFYELQQDGLYDETRQGH
ncbi:MAG: hypothetical protein Q9170_005688 [Blastenia crenularia]